MWHVWERLEVYIGFWWREMMTRNYLEGSGVEWRIILALILLMWRKG
jgi:hypothetical protein